jgi:dolichyl-phosphate beta-glucosyltransferase
MLSVIIPAFDEELRLPTTLSATADYFLSRNEDFELLVVDDGSRDGTAKVVSHFQTENPQLKVRCLSYGGNRGKGYAVRFGMLEAQGDLRLFCDADLATPIQEYDVLLKQMTAQSAAIAIGSRPLKNSNLLVHQPWFREQAGRMFNRAVQMLAIPGIADTQCGFKMFTADAAKDVFSRAKLDGFAFDIEALLIASRLGYSIVEVPIRWSHKDGSKVSLVRDGIKMLRDLSTVRWTHRSLKPASSGPSTVKSKV